MHQQPATSQHSAGSNIQNVSEKEMFAKMANPLLDMHKNAMGNFSAANGGSTADTGSRLSGAEAGSGTGTQPATAPASAPTSQTAVPSSETDPATTDLASALRTAKTATGDAAPSPAAVQDPSIQNVVVSKEKYDQLLDLQPAMEAKNKEIEAMKSELEEWRGLRSLTGASKASEIAERVASARTREVKDFKDLVDEALPEIERIYRSADASQQEYLKPYLESCRLYADHPEKVSLGEMNNAKGFIGLICGTVRAKNTEVTEKDAEVRALQARCAAAEERANEATKQLTIVTTASAKRKTITQFDPSEFGLPRVPSHTTGQETPTLTNQYNQNIPSTTSPASVPSTTGKRSSPFVSPFANQNMFGSQPTKKFRVFNPENGEKVEVEASGFYLKPEERYINYFLPEHREDAIRRAAEAEKMFQALQQTHTQYYSHTPMEKHFLPLGEKELTQLKSASEIQSLSFERGIRRVY